MAQRVAEEGPAGLVQVLAVDEDQHLGGWVGRERRDGRVRHLGNSSRRGRQKAPVIQREAGAGQATDNGSAARPGSPKHRHGFRQAVIASAGTALDGISPSRAVGGAGRAGDSSGVGADLVVLVGRADGITGHPRQDLHRARVCGRGRIRPLAGETARLSRPESGLTTSGTLTALPEARFCVASATSPVT